MKVAAAKQQIAHLRKSQFHRAEVSGLGQIGPGQFGLGLGSARSTHEVMNESEITPRAQA